MSGPMFAAVAFTAWCLALALASATEHWWNHTDAPEEDS